MYDLYDYYETSSTTNAKPFIICAAVFLLLLIGVTAFTIIRDQMWREKKTKLAEKKCAEYVKYACENPISNQTIDPIILGDDAHVGMFPHQALVEFRTQGYSMSARKCGGILISENFVLSAAHCSYGLKDYVGTVKLGSVIRGYDNTGEWCLVNKAYPHHSYNHGTGENDLLLLKLNKTVQFKPHLRPICLNTKFQGKYSRIITSGWGVTEDELEPVHLKWVELYIDKSVKSKCRVIASTLIDTNLICAGHPTKSNSAHKGDSGGPLQVPLNNSCPNTYELIGVTAAVENRQIDRHQTLLSFYTRVDYYIPWIASHVWPNE